MHRRLCCSHHTTAHCPCHVKCLAVLFAALRQPSTQPCWVGLWDPWHGSVPTRRQQQLAAKPKWFQHCWMCSAWSSRLIRHYRRWRQSSTACSASRNSSSHRSSHHPRRSQSQSSSQTGHVSVTTVEDKLFQQLHRQHSQCQNLHKTLPCRLKHCVPHSQRFSSLMRGSPPGWHSIACGLSQHHHAAAALHPMGCPAANLVGGMAQAQEA